MKGAVDRVSTAPSGVDCGIGTEHVVVHRKVVKPKTRYSIDVGAGRTHVTTELCLRKDRSEIHDPLLARSLLCELRDLNAACGSVAHGQTDAYGVVTLVIVISKSTRPSRCIAERYSSQAGCSPEMRR